MQDLETQAGKWGRYETVTERCWMFVSRGEHFASHSVSLPLWCSAFGFSLLVSWGRPLIMAWQDRELSGDRDLTYPPLCPWGLAHRSPQEMDWVISTWTETTYCWVPLEEVFQREEGHWTYKIPDLESRKIDRWTLKEVHLGRAWLERKWTDGTSGCGGQENVAENHQGNQKKKHDHLHLSWNMIHFRLSDMTTATVNIPGSSVWNEIVIISI